MNKYKDSGIDKRVIWDLVKIKIKEFSISFSKELTSFRCRKKEQLENDLKLIESEINNNCCILSSTNETSFTI